MNLEELQKKLNNLGINPGSYSLSGSSCDECYVITNDGPSKWSVYYSERGLRSSQKIYNNESEACEDLYRRLRKDPTVKKKL